MLEITKKRSSQEARLRIDHLPASEIEAFERAGTIISDPARRRPRYFDGRFLAAPDLVREQDYFIGRQAELTRAAGAGTLHGLQVTRVDDTRVRIARGNGITPSGDLVVLTETITVDLADVAEMQRLDQTFGLDALPNEPPRRRTGLFVLALRPVEYTANPIAAYPSSIAERRAIDDGEIIEAVAVTLVPYREDHVELTPQQQRGLVAHRIFVEGKPGAAPAEALPIAMMQLDRGFVLWIDPWLVRREIGTEHAGVSGFGLTPRAVREAHVQQFNQQLHEVVLERTARPGPGEDDDQHRPLQDRRRFPATEFCRTLPPVGQLPSQAIQKIESFFRFTQIFFPPQMRVHATVVPSDEIPALVEEALLLPPLDLSVPPEDLDFSSVLVLIGLTRDRIEHVRETIAQGIYLDLGYLDPNGAVPPRKQYAERLRPLMEPVLEPAAPGLLVRRQPVEILRRLLPTMPTTDDRRAVARSGLRETVTRAAATPFGRSVPAGNPLSPVRRAEAPAVRITDATSGGGAVRLAALPPDLENSNAGQAANQVWAELVPDIVAQPYLWYVRTRLQDVTPDAVSRIPRETVLT